jgi:acetyl-CoA acetyltransferase
MREVGIIAFAQAPNRRRVKDANEVEILLPVLHEVLERAGMTKYEVDFVCSGSSDYLAGMPFTFVLALDAYGAWPPISESHVEMDGAWALYEAWVKLQTGEIDTALVYAFGKSSLGKIGEVLCMQLDPYTLTPLWPDAVSLAALQARACLEAGRFTEADMAGVAVRDRAHATDNPNAQVSGTFSVDELLSSTTFISPLRRHDCPPISDGAAAVILAADDAARARCERPAWIRGIDHRIEAHQLGDRDLTISVSTRIAAEAAGLFAGGGGVDVAEIAAPFTHQILLVEEALGIHADADTVVNPSGGPLAANPVMVSGLTRIGEAASRIIDGTAKRAVAHATSGPCLQQNLVCVMEGA